MRMYMFIYAMLDNVYVPYLRTYMFIYAMLENVTPYPAARASGIGGHPERERERKRERER